MATGDVWGDSWGDTWASAWAQAALIPAEVEAFQAELSTIQAAFVEDYGPVLHDPQRRQRLAVKVVMDWKERRRQKRRLRRLEILATAALMDTTATRKHLKALDAYVKNAGRR